MKSIAALHSAIQCVTTTWDITNNKINPLRSDPLLQEQISVMAQSSHATAFTIRCSNNIESIHKAFQKGEKNLQLTWVLIHIDNIGKF